MALRKLVNLFKSEPKENSATSLLRKDENGGSLYSLEKHHPSSGMLSTSTCITYSLDPEEVKQLEEIRPAFLRNQPIEGAIKNVVFLFAVELLGQKDFVRRLTDLQKLQQLYVPQLGEKLSYLPLWVSDIYAEIGDLKNALFHFPRPKISGRAGFATDKLLSLKHALGLDAEASDVLSLMGPKLTKWGREHLEQVAGYIEAELTEQKKMRSHTFLSDWVKGAWSGQYQIYNGCIHSTQLTNLKLYGFSTHQKISDLIETLSQEAENTAREESGIPKIGEGWLAETELYYRLKEHLRGIDVIHHGRPDWLGRQHLDIFIPSLRVAIEYQGEQHDKPVEYFGGVEAFKKTLSRDKKKMRLCKQNGIALIYVRSGYVLEAVIQEIHLASKTSIVVTD